MNVGVRIFNSCDKKSAIPYFKKHINDNPTDGMGYYYCGLSNRIIGNLYETERNWSVGLAKAENYSHKKFILANLLFIQRNDCEKALVEANKALANDPTFGDCYSLIGDIQFGKEQIEEAFENYENAIIFKASDSNWAYLKMGDYYFSNNNLEAANDAYENAINECDCFTAAFVRKARVAAKQGKWNVYEECIKTAMTYNPEVLKHYESEISDTNEKLRYENAIKNVNPDKNKTFAQRGNKKTFNKKSSTTNNNVGKNDPIKGKGTGGGGDGSDGNDSGDEYCKSGENQSYYNEVYKELIKQGVFDDNTDFSAFQKDSKRFKPEKGWARQFDFYKVKSLEGLRIDGKKVKSIWISPIHPDSQHASYKEKPTHKVFIQRGDSLHFAGSIQKNGKPLLNKTESNNNKEPVRLN